jgi:transposase
MVDMALAELWAHFEALYSRQRRPSIPPERLLRAPLLQVLYSIRSEPPLMEQLDYNLLFRWFVGLNPDDKVRDVTRFSMTWSSKELLPADVFFLPAPILRVQAR